MNPSTQLLSSSTTFFLLSLFFLSFLALLSSAQNTYEGCYTVDNTLVVNDTSIYQSKGRCGGQICSPSDYAVFGMMGDECYCGNSIPAKQVTGNFCNLQCPGYPNDTCGGTGYISVWLSGVGNLVGSAATQILSATTTGGSTAPPSSTVIYITTGQSTVTATPTPSNSGSPSGGSGVSGGAAAGIVIGVLAIFGIALGAFIYVRRRKKQESYQQTYENSALGSSPGSLSRPFAPDQRLEPGMVQKRESVGSLADERDYSRKILRVTNPDGD